MSELWPLLLVSLFISWWIENRDRKLLRQTHHRDHLWTFYLIIILSVFCGLRTWYNDTVTYIAMYEQTPLLSEFRALNTSNLAQGFGFALFNSIMKTIGLSTQDHLMVYAFITVTPYVLFVRKYSPHFMFGVFLMFTTGFYTFTFAAIKQCVATGLCLLAVMSALDKKWVRYGVFITLGFLFHPYSIVYLLVPLMMFRPWTKWNYIYIVLFVVTGFMLESLQGTILDVTDMLGAHYDETSFVGEGVNIFRVIVSFVPIILSIPYVNILFMDSTNAENLIFNLAMIHALIMFVGLFGTANYFARLANYFLPAHVVVLPWMLNKIYYRHRAFLKTSCIIGYTSYFMYDNLIRHRFDDAFNQVGLFDYISSHF